MKSRTLAGPDHGQPNMMGSRLHGELAVVALLAVVAVVALVALVADGADCAHAISLYKRSRICR